jgi:acetylornithine deacetylase/succinyl-diaminopimelate desuccinylase-like protein
MVRVLVEQHIRKQGYTLVSTVPDVETLRQHEKIALLEWSDHGYPAVWMDMSDPRATALSTILMRARDGKVVRVPTMGGSLPLHDIQQTLNVPIVMLPMANHDNNQHSPNENLRVQNLWDAIEIYAAVFSALGMELE